MQKNNKELKDCRLLVMDLDDTLVPFRKALVSYNQTLIKGLSEKTGLDKSVFLDEFNKNYSEYGIFQHEDVINGFSVLKEKYPNENLAQKFSAEIKKAKKALENKSKVTDEFKKTLDMAKKQGVKIALYTGGPASFTIDKLEYAGIGNLFDAIYTADDKELPFRNDVKIDHKSDNWGKIKVFPRNSKTNEKGLKQIAKDLLGEKCDMLEVVMMGDNPVQDVMMAQKAGAKSVHVVGFRNEKLSDEGQVVLNSILKKSEKQKQELAKVSTIPKPSKKWLQEKLNPDYRVEKAEEFIKILVVEKQKARGVYSNVIVKASKQR